MIGKRRIKWIVTPVLALLVGGLATLTAFLSQPEKIDRYWTSATLDAGTTAAITEQIDYDFAQADEKHGIIRIIPGLDASAPVDVSSPDAPATVLRTSLGSETQLRIGDADTEVTGKHRYAISYELGTLINANNEIAWNAYGTEWEVGSDEVVAYLSAPNELSNVRCFEGGYGAQARCDVRTLEPGLLEVTAADVPENSGITIYATRGFALGAVPVAPAPPTEVPPAEGMNPFIPGLIAFATALLLAVLIGRVCISAGRERVGGTGAADAAYAKDSTSYRRVDMVELAQLATTEFVPPKELTPAQGGVLLSEAVKSEHQTAWLMQTAIDGHIEVEGEKKDVTLRRLEKDGYANLLLNRAFASREEITLGKYDAEFASAWKGIGQELDGWRKSSGLWDPAGDRRQTLAVVLGILAVLIGAVLTGVASAFAGRGIEPLLIAVAIGAGMAGGGIGALMFVGDLKVRTPEGSALWLRTESFRRFLNKSEAQHVDYAAKNGLLREYTAWALALGESDHWNSAMAASSVEPDPRDASFIYAAPYIGASALSASTAPSSSGSGGGGGGFSGGGGGGGGGGSW